MLTAIIFILLSNVYSSHQADAPPSGVGKANVEYCVAQCLGITEKNCSRFDYRNDLCSQRFEPKTNHKVFCYFEGIEFDVSEFEKSDELINQRFCTHILIGPFLKFSDVKNETEEIKKAPELFEKYIKQYKAAGIKVLLTLGDFPNNLRKSTTIGPDDFSKIAANEAVREKFLKQLVSLLNRFNMDGVNFRWIYPGTFLGITPGADHDLPNFRKLLAILRNMTGGDKVLSAEVQREGVMRAPDPYVQYFLDFLLLYPHEYGMTATPTVNYFAPLASVRRTIEFHKAFLKNNSKKVLIGTRQAVRTFNFMPIPAAAKFKNITTLIGAVNMNIPSMTLAVPWFTFMKRIQGVKWKVAGTQPNTQALATDGVTWASFEEPEYMAQLAKLVKQYDLGGMFIRYPFDDDYTDELGCGEFPFMRTLNENLRGDTNSCKLKAKCP